MTVLESIINELQDLPTAKQVEVARYVHRLSETGRTRRWELLGELYGSVNDHDGQVFEEALRSSRREPENG
jgi:hypothetical protein